MCADSMLKDKLSINNKPQNFVKSDITSEKLEKSYILYDKLYCNIQEIAFNYMSNFIKARLIYRGRYKYLLNLRSYKGLLFIKQILKQKEYAFYENLYEEYLSYIMEYVYSRAENIENLFGKTSQQIELNAYKKFLHNSSSYDYVYKLDKEKLIKYVLFFAKLEIIYNTKTMIKDTSYLTNDENELTNDLIKRCNSFKEDFIKLSSEKIY